MNQEQEQLWPRFKKVRRAIARAMQPDPIEGIERNWQRVDWAGFDSGAHDHAGTVKGVIDNIAVNIRLTGTVFDNQQQLVETPDGQIVLQNERQSDLEITCSFVSSDGLLGFLQAKLLNTRQIYEAYWFQAGNGFLRLEQLKTSQNVVFDANRLCPDMEEVTVPGSDIRLPRFIREQLSFWLD